LSSHRHDLQCGGRAVTAKDSNGKELSNGDAVQVIKDLKVKGHSETLKRG